MNDVIPFPGAAIPFSDTEELIFRLNELKFTPMVKVSNDNVMSLVFEIEAVGATAEGLQLAGETTRRFEQDAEFRGQFFDAVWNYGQVLQEYGMAAPRLDPARTLDDTRRALGLIP